MKHNRIKTFTVCITLFLLVTATALLAQKNPKDQFDFPKLNKVKMPKVKTVTLKNGLKLFLVEDHKYPTVNMRLLIHSGSVFEPADKTGLASVTGNAWRTGGSKRMSGDEIDKKLETMAASIETYFSDDIGQMTVSLLKENLDQVLPIMADILKHPVFNEDKIKLAKIRMRTNISRRNDDVGQITSREFNKLIYGAKSAWGRQAEYATIDAITKKDIIAFYKKFVHPNNTIIAVWGDFKTRQMVSKLKKHLGTWPAGSVKLAPLPKVNYQFKYTVNFIDKPDVNQSNIMMGHIGGTYNNPDMPALLIMNRILSFDRMFKKIRTDEGLAYSVWGSYGANYRVPGVFSAGAQTKSKSTVYAIKLMLAEMKRIQTEEVSELELKRAKDQYLNTFVFAFDSKSKIINRMITYVYNKYPLDFTEQTMKKVENVTKADVLRVAKKYLKPDKVQILVVGKKADFDKPLSSLGNVNVIDITIPTPKGEEGPAATADSLSKGKAVFEKAVAAMADPAKIKAIKNVRIKMEIEQMGMKMPAVLNMVYPDKINFKITTPGGEAQIIINGEKSVMAFGGQKGPLPAAQKKSMTGNVERDMVYMYQNLDKYKIQLIGKTKFNGQEAVDLLCKGVGDPFHLFFNVKNLDCIGASYQSITQSGPAKVVETFSNFKTVDGFRLSFKSDSSANGKKASGSVTSEIKYNVKIDESLFKTE